MATVGLLGSCSSGGGEEGGSAPLPIPVPSPGPPVNLGALAGAVVGAFDVDLPDEAQFLLRGTLPVPAGVFTDTSTELPLAIENSDGETVVTQVEIASRYPSPTDGAEVLEIMARVERPAGMNAGERARYDIRLLDSAVALPTPSATPLEELADGPSSLPTALVNLLSDPESIVLRTRDVFGHRYELQPLGSNNTKQLLKFGPIQTQVRTYNSMQPVSPQTGSSGTLPHLFGVHSYMTTTSQESVLLLDMRLNNGAADVTGSEDDDVLNHVYFDAFEVVVPSGWEVLQAYEDPGVGSSYNESGKRVRPLVTAAAGGKKHYFPMSGQMHRRLAICPSSAVDRARDLLESQGLGFCVRDFNADTSQDLWHWSNPSTARYLAQSFQLPTLEHLGNSNVRASLAGDFAELESHVLSGVGKGGYPISADRLGWAHPYGAPYGGMTGGDEIHLFEGVSTAAVGSLEGYRRFQLLHRMHSDRQRNIFYKINGLHLSYLDLLVEDGGVGYVPLNFYMKFNGGTDTLNITTKPNFQVDAAVNLGLVPDYKDDLQGFESHDIQHLIRYTRSAKVLSWLGNDSLSKDDLLAQAELVRLSYHPHWNSPTDNSQSTGMRQDIDDVLANPGAGFGFGRAEGWITDTVANAYCLADPTWRATASGWGTTLAELLSAGQVGCKGYIMAAVASKVLDGNYRAAQSYSVSIVGNGMRGLQHAFFVGHDTTHANQMQSVLQNHYYGFIDPMAWNSTKNGPIEMYAVAPPATTSAPYCDISQVPADGQDNGVNKYQTYSTLGYAFDLTGDGVFLTRAGEMIGGDLLTELLGGGTNNINNRAALLAVAQRVNGML